MSKYIDREKLIKRLEATCDIVCQYSKAQRFVMCGSCGLGSALEVLEDFPAADVHEVRHGRWIKIANDWVDDAQYICSCCGRLLTVSNRLTELVSMSYPYCHCGAKMDNAIQHAECVENALGSLEEAE